MDILEFCVFKAFNIIDKKRVDCPAFITFNKQNGIIEWLFREENRTRKVEFNFLKIPPLDKEKLYILNAVTEITNIILMSEKCLSCTNRKDCIMSGKRCCIEAMKLQTEKIINFLNDIDLRLPNLILDMINNSCVYRIVMNDNKTDEAFYVDKLYFLYISVKFLISFYDENEDFDNNEAKKYLNDIMCNIEEAILAREKYETNSKQESKKI